MMRREPDSTHEVHIVFAGGGTGGHLYPALAVAAELRRREPVSRLVFLGSDRRIDEQILSSEGCACVPQSLPKLSKAPWRWPAILGGYRRAMRSCREMMRRTRPSVVVGSGGAASLPAMIEARRAGVPTVLFNPDVLPGRANRYLARRADLVLVQWEESVDHFPHTRRIRVTGCPVRAAFAEDSGGSARAARFGLDPAKRTLLITGASLGARTINRAVIACLDVLRRFPEWQVLHLTGEADYQEVRRAHLAADTAGAVLAYTHDMPDALKTADLVVSRGGASTLAELTTVGRASILLPYPFHRDMHQRANASVLADGGAALVLEDRIDPRLNAPRLRSALEGLMMDAARRTRMAEAASRLGRRDAGEVVADHILTLAAGMTTDAPESVKEGAARARY